MADITVKWLDDEHTLLAFFFDKDFSISEYKIAVEKSREMVTISSTKQFHIVADVSQITLIPTLMISTMKSVYLKPEDSFSGTTIFIGAPLFIRYTVSVFSKVFKAYQFYFCDELLSPSQFRQFVEENAYDL